MTKTNWLLLVLIFVVGTLGLVIGGQQGIKEGYDRGYYDGLYAEPVVVAANNTALGNSGYINFDNESSERDSYDANQTELAQQIMDFLGQASKVDISLQGDKDTGGTLDVHLEFTK